MINPLILTTTALDEAMSNAIANALGGIMALMAIGLIIGIAFLIAIVALITWVVKKVWYAGSNKRQKIYYRPSNQSTSPTGWTYNENTQLWEPPDYKK